MNKKGQMVGILIFFGALFIALFIGFMASVGVAFIDWTADNTLPELENLGDAGDVNFTKISSLTITPANTFIQSLPAIIGVLYIVCLFGCIGLAYVYRTTEQKWLLFLFFGFTVMLVMAGMGMSIIYEDFYNDEGEFGDRLKEQTLMSFLILYSPAIFVIIAVIGATVMFTGFDSAGGGV